MANQKHPHTPLVDPRDPRGPLNQRHLREEELRAVEREHARAAEDERERADEDDDADAEAPTREGDILGISDAKAAIPKAPRPRGGHPRGIEVEDSTDRPGTRDVQQTPGATSIDMGGAGEGNKVKP